MTLPAPHEPTIPAGPNQPGRDESAASSWLLSSAPDPETARREWRDQSVALLECGRQFSAARLPDALVHTAAGTSHEEEVDDYLGFVLESGPLFRDRSVQAYYVLVWPGAAPRWSTREFPQLAYLGRDHYLGVPAPGTTDPGRRLHWVVPMSAPGALCDVHVVSELVDVAHRRLRTAVEGGRS